MGKIRRRMSSFVALREEASWLALLGVLLVISVANNTAISWLGPFGEMAVAAILSIGVILFLAYLTMTARLPGIVRGLVVSVLYFVFVYVVSLAVHREPTGLKTVAGTMGGLSLFVAVVLFRWRSSGLRVLSAIIGLFVVGSALIGVIEILGGSARVSGVFSNPNAFASFMLMAFYVFLLARVAADSSAQRAVITALATISVCLMITAGTRSAWLAVAASSFTYWFWPYLTRSRAVHVAFLLCFATALVAMVAFVVLVPTLEIGQTINQVTETVTGRQLRTGRELIWLDVLNEVSKRPVLGHGPHVTAGGFGNLQLGSAHNMYLQIALQVGAVGLVGFLGLMGWIWNRLGDATETEVARTTGAILIGVLLQQNFEVSLTHNNLTLGLLAWIVVGIGVSASIWRPAWAVRG